MSRIKLEDHDQRINSTRQRLLDTAALEFSRHGFDTANINTISLSAGFAKGTIYNYFPSKHKLLQALVSQTAGLHHAYISERVSQESDPLRRLDRFFTSGFAFVTENLPRMKVMINVIYGADREMQTHIFTAYQPLFAFVARDVVAHGIAGGQFRQVDPASMSSLLMTIYLGAASHVTDEGYFFITPEQVADFARRALIAV